MLTKRSPLHPEQFKYQKDRQNRHQDDNRLIKWLQQELSRKALAIRDAATGAGGWARALAAVLGMGLTILYRGWRQSANDVFRLDGQKGITRLVSHCLIDAERQGILLSCHQCDIAALSLLPLWPIPADRGCYNSFGEDSVNGSEHSL